MVKDLKHEIGQILMLMTRDFQRRLDDDLLARGVRGIGHRHRGVFLHLARCGASRSVELAAAAGIRPQSMMKVVHELEDLGLVTRRTDPADSRAKLIEFTDAGRELIEELTRSTKTVWKQYARLIGTDDLTAAFTSLRYLLELSGREKQDE